MQARFPVQSRGLQPQGADVITNSQTKSTGPLGQVLECKGWGDWGCDVTVRRKKTVSSCRTQTCSPSLTLSQLEGTCLLWGQTSLPWSTLVPIPVSPGDILSGIPKTALSCILDSGWHLKFTLTVIRSHWHTLFLESFWQWTVPQFALCCTENYNWIQLNAIIRNKLDLERQMPCFL